MKTVSKKYILVVFFVLQQYVNYAAPDPPNPSATPPPLPIDQYVLSLVAVLSIVYGVYKIVKLKKGVSN